MKNRTRSFRGLTVLLLVAMLFVSTAITANAFPPDPDEPPPPPPNEPPPPEPPVSNDSDVLIVPTVGQILYQ